MEALLWSEAAGRYVQRRTTWAARRRPTELTIQATGRYHRLYFWKLYGKNQPADDSTPAMSDGDDWHNRSEYDISHSVPSPGGRPLGYDKVAEQTYVPRAPASFFTMVGRLTKS